MHLLQKPELFEWPGYDPAHPSARGLRWFAPLHRNVHIVNVEGNEPQWAPDNTIGWNSSPHGYALRCPKVGNFGNVGMTTQIPVGLHKFSLLCWIRNSAPGGFVNYWNLLSDLNCFLGTSTANTTIRFRYRVADFAFNATNNITGLVFNQYYQIVITFDSAGGAAGGCKTYANGVFKNETRTDGGLDLPNFVEWNFGDGASSLGTTIFLAAWNRVLRHAEVMDLASTFSLFNPQREVIGADQAVVAAGHAGPLVNSIRLKSKLQGLVA